MHLCLNLPLHCCYYGWIICSEGRSPAPHALDPTLPTRLQRTVPLGHYYQKIVHNFLFYVLVILSVPTVKPLRLLHIVSLHLLVLLTYTFGIVGFLCHIPTILTHPLSYQKNIITLKNILIVYLFLKWNAKKERNIYVRA